MLFNKYKRMLKEDIHNNFIYYFILSVLFIAGNIIGPILFKKLTWEYNSMIVKFLNPYIDNLTYKDHSLSIIFRNRIFSNLIYMIILFLLGTFSQGLYLIPILILYKGIAVGFIVSYLIYSYSFKGFLISIIGIYPQNIFITMSFIFLGALTMSISKGISFRKGRQIYGQEYIFIATIYLLVLIVLSLIEGYFTYKIIGLL